MARCNKSWLLAMITAPALVGCTLLNTVVHNFPDLDDHRIFANRTVGRPQAASRLRELSAVPGFITDLQVPDEAGARMTLERYLADTRTVAFVVMHDDRVVYEHYARGYDAGSLFNSFSISKSILAVLVGIAMEDGAIRDLDASVADYRPELAGTAYGAVPLRSLLMMNSGAGEGAFRPLARAKFYYTDDLAAEVAGAERHSPIEARWRYSEADAQVLGLVLEAAVGRTLSAYLAEKIWRPLGMEADALWALDREGGREKAFCCISARARDFARLGRLMAGGGRWEGRQVVPEAWARHAVVPGVTAPCGYVHRHLWWFPEGAEDDYYAYGHRGQYLYVNPRARTVIVKFSETKWQDPVPMFRAVSAALRNPAHLAELDRLERATLARQ